MGQQVVDIYDNLKPEDFPQFPYKEAVEWIKSQQAAAKMIGAEGQIRVDLKRNRLVRLIEPAYDQTENGVRHYKSDWHCEDILTEERYRINMFDWGNVMNEMEVMAWAAQ